MKSEFIKINGKLEVWMDDVICKTIVHDIADKFIAIGVPMKDGMFSVPETGAKLDFMYYEDLSVYKFEAKILGRRTENNIPQILISEPENVKKIQRRQFVRVSVVSYIQYVKLENGIKPFEIEEKFGKQKGLKGLLMDLSGGGLKLKVYDPVKAGDRIITEIPSENEKIRVAGQIVRAEKGEDGRVVCGINFADIDYKTREKIVQLIFTIMRKQRKTL